MLIELKCPNCGAELNVENNRDFYFCTYCGTKIVNISPQMSGNVTIDTTQQINNLLIRAKRELDDCNMDAALKLYDNALNIDANNADAIIGYYYIKGLLAYREWSGISCREGDKNLAKVFEIDPNYEPAKIIQRRYNFRRLCREAEDAIEGCSSACSGPHKYDYKTAIDKYREAFALGTDEDTKIEKEKFDRLKYLIKVNKGESTKFDYIAVDCDMVNGQGGWLGSPKLCGKRDSWLYFGHPGVNKFTLKGPEKLKGEFSVTLTEDNPICEVVVDLKSTMFSYKYVITQNSFKY